MLSQIPIKIEKLSKDKIDMELLRVGMIAATDNENLKKVFLDIAKEEKTHFGEFQALLLKLDKEQVEELEKGKEEVKELVG